MECPQIMSTDVGRLICNIREENPEVENPDFGYDADIFPYQQP
jgi:hypothetical protein